MWETEASQWRAVFFGGRLTGPAAHKQSTAAVLLAFANLTFFLSTNQHYQGPTPPSSTPSQLLPCKPSPCPLGSPMLTPRSPSRPSPSSLSQVCSHFHTSWLCSQCEAVLQANHRYSWYVLSTLNGHRPDCYHLRLCFCLFLTLRPHRLRRPLPQPKSVRLPIPNASTQLDYPANPIRSRTKHCWQNYVDYYKCVNAKGEDFKPCRQVTAPRCTAL